MKIAHTVIVTPHRAGIYETARDLVAAERSRGVDAWIVDPKQHTVDRGVPIGRGGSGIEEADLIINHSGLGAIEKENEKPVIHCLHGRPESSFRLEANGTVGVYTFISNVVKKPTYKRFVTFWPEFVPYWSMLVPKEKLSVVTAPVDLVAWTPDGPSGYKFGGKGGEINVVITDMWREDVTPYHAIHAFCAFAETHPGARLHIYGLHRHTALDVLLGAVKERGWLGEAAGMVTGLANVYRAADVLLSPHKIATRAIREALACGCPVARGRTMDEMVAELKRIVSTEYLGARATARTVARQTAEENFDSKHTAEQMIKIAEEVLSCHE